MHQAPADVCVVIKEARKVNVFQQFLKLRVVAEINFCSEKRICDGPPLANGISIWHGISRCLNKSNVFWSEQGKRNAEVVPRFNKSFAAHNINSPGEASAIFLRVSRARGFLWPRLSSSQSPIIYFYFNHTTNAAFCSMTEDCVSSHWNFNDFNHENAFNRAESCVREELVRRSRKRETSMIGTGESLNKAIKCWMLNISLRSIKKPFRTYPNTLIHTAEKHYLLFKTQFNRFFLSISINIAFCSRRKKALALRSHQ